MSDSAKCCDECFDLLARQSPPAAALWIKLCEIQETCRIFALRIDDNPYLTLLEKARFITTSETADTIIVKVHGKIYDPDGSYFCGGCCGK